MHESTMRYASSSVVRAFAKLEVWVMRMRSESFGLVQPVAGQAYKTLTSFHRQMRVETVIKIQCMNCTTSLLAARTTLQVLSLVYLGDEEMGPVIAYRQE